MAKAKAKKKKRLDRTAQRKALWEREGYVQLFARVRAPVMAVLDEHVAARVREQEAVGWASAKYSRTEAVVNALQSYLGLAPHEMASTVSVDQLTLPNIESKPKRQKAAP